MGISQLNKFIKAHFKDKVLENLLVRQMDVVIDGSSLYFFLYFNSNLDQIHGGDYSGFEDEVCQFFRTLRECGVTPLVFLDGGSDADKITLEARMRNKIEKIIAKQNLDSSSPGKQDILPPLIKDVFIQILREINVEFEQCSGEADSRMVHRANMKNCPVLSNDADFYIFDVPGGFLPLDTFDWRHVSNGEIPAERYRIEAFCDYFNLDKALMPVFASLAGNDYSKLDDKGAFFTQYPPPDHLKSKDYYINRLHAILLFLGSLDLTDLNDSEKRERALSEAFRVVEFPKFLKSIQKYEPENPKETPSCLPGWLYDRLRSGELASFATDVVLHKRMILTPLMEDLTQPSSHNAATYTRQYFYGLLLGPNKKCTEYNRRIRCEDSECCRNSLCYKLQKGQGCECSKDSMSLNKVKSLLPNGGGDEQTLDKLQLQHLNEAPEDLRRQVLDTALMMEELTLGLEEIPESLRLPVCVTRFWFRHRQKHYQSSPNTHYLHALLQGFLHHPQKPGQPTGSHVEAQREGNSLDLDAAHAFSQWQVCLRQGLHLNQLLCFPLPEPKCAQLYNGPLVHQLALDRTAFSGLQKSMDEKQKKLFKVLKDIVEK